MKKNLIIILLAILSVGAIGYIVYEKADKENKENNLGDNYKLEDFTKIINDELQFLISQKDLKDITNKEKTYMIYELIEDKSNLNLTINELEKVKKNSSLREMNVEYTDIYDSYVAYVLANEVLLSLNKESGVYSRVAGGHGGTAIWTESFLQDFKIEENKYIVSYKYVFIKAQGTGPTDLDMYYKFEDGVNNQNKIKEFSIEDVNFEYQTLKNQVSTYADENYESFKDKLDTYYFVFEIHNENIVLVDFYRK